MLGYSPGGSRVIPRGDGISVLGKNLFNYRYKERLEKNSVVGKLVEKKIWITWFMWNTNKTPRQGICTTYVGHRCLSVLLKERRHWGLPGQILEAQAKLAGLVSTHIPDGNSAGRGKNDTGESVFPGTDPICLFFRFAYILFVIHRDEYRVTRGQQTSPLSKSGASYKIIQRS